MKKSKVLLGALIAIMMVALLSVTAMSATTTPGGSTSVSFSVSDIYGIQATSVETSGSSNFTISSPYVSGSGFVHGSVGFGSEPTTYTVTVDVTASAEAKVGDSVTITIYYDYTTDSIDLHSSSYTETVTIK